LLVTTALRAAGGGRDTGGTDHIGESEMLLFLMLLKEVGEPLFAAMEAKNKPLGVKKRR
jgi:hypothetical protein